MTTRAVSLVELVETPPSRDHCPMRPLTRRRGAPTVLATVLAAVLTGCAGTQAASPAPQSSTATSLRPPLAGDLGGGTAVQLGAAGHWTIADGRAYTTNDQGTVLAIELATGVTAWQATFGQGEPWDAQPTIGLTADRRTVVAVRTVDVDASARLDLLMIDAGTGAVQAEHLVSDPAHRWRVDLPPRVLAADAATVVLADNPESGRQSGVVAASDGALAWAADEQAVAATEQVVVTRAGGRSRADGTPTWRASTPIGPLVAQSSSALVVRSGSAAAWIEAATGREVSRSAALAEAEPACAPATDAVVCLVADGVSGHDPADGQRLWSSAEPADAIVTVRGWAYLWRGGSARGDVLDARTGELFEHNVELPPIRYSDDTGVLLAAENGYRWVPFPR